MISSSHYFNNSRSPGRKVTRRKVIIMPYLYIHYLDYISDMRLIWKSGMLYNFYPLFMELGIIFSKLRLYWYYLYTYDFSYLALITNSLAVHSVCFKLSWSSKLKVKQSQKLLVLHVFHIFMIIDQEFPYKPQNWILHKNPCTVKLTLMWRLIIYKTKEDKLS